MDYDKPFTNTPPAEIKHLSLNKPQVLIQRINIEFEAFAMALRAKGDIMASDFVLKTLWKMRKETRGMDNPRSKLLVYVASMKKIGEELQLLNFKRGY